MYVKQENFTLISVIPHVSQCTQLGLMNIASLVLNLTYISSFASMKIDSYKNPVGLKYVRYVAHVICAGMLVG